MRSENPDQTKLNFENGSLGVSESAPDVPVDWGVKKRNTPRIPSESEYREILRVVRQMKEEDESRGISRQVSVKDVQRRLIGAAVSEALRSRIVYVLDREKIPRRIAGPRGPRKPKNSPKTENSPKAVNDSSVPLTTGKVGTAEERQVRKIAVLSRLARKALAGDVVASAVFDEIMSEDM